MAVESVAGCGWNGRPDQRGIGGRMGVEYAPYRLSRLNFRISNFSPLHASLFFVALAWTLPFLQWHHKPPIPSFYSGWLAFGLGLLALVPLLSKRYWQPLVLPRSFLFVLGFIALLVLQVVLERVLYPQQALVGALYILWAAFLLGLGNQCCESTWSTQMKKPN